MPPHRILVVDDDDFSRELLCAVLAGDGYLVESVADGESALALLSAHEVDAVLLDVSMPGMDGIAVCREIKKSKRALPVVFVTGANDKSSRRTGKEAGADDFLTKPVDEAELQARMKNLLEAKAYHDLRERHARVLEEELEKARAQLLYLERLATLGTLAAGVGHELNNLAAICVAAVSFIKTDAKEGRAPTADDVEQLENVSRHITTHAKHLLGMGRPKHEEDQAVDLGATIAHALAMLSTAARVKGVELAFVPPFPPIQLELSRVRLEQVLVNVILNASDACRELRDRLPRIQIEVTRDAGEGSVSVRIIDNGTGISEEHLPRLFEPYFTTKGADRGTGLGLPVVRQIMKSQDGGIEISSRLGEGTAVRLWWPKARVLGA